MPRTTSWSQRAGDQNRPRGKPENRVGCMLAGGNFYPYPASRKTADGAGEGPRENLFFIDVQAARSYPAYSARVFREKAGW